MMKTWRIVQLSARTNQSILTGPIRDSKNSLFYCALWPAESARARRRFSRGSGGIVMPGVLTPGMCGDASGDI